MGLYQGETDPFPSPHSPPPRALSHIRNHGHQRFQDRLHGQPVLHCGPIVLLSGGSNSRVTMAPQIEGDAYSVIYFWRDGCLECTRATPKFKKLSQSTPTDAIKYYTMEKSVLSHRDWRDLWVKHVRAQLWNRRIRNPVLISEGDPCV